MALRLAASDIIGQSAALRIEFRIMCATCALNAFIAGSWPQQRMTHRLPPTRPGIAQALHHVRDGVRRRETRRPRYSPSAWPPFPWRNEYRHRAATTTSRTASARCGYVSRPTQTVHEHRLGVRGPLKTSLNAWSPSFSTQSVGSSRPASGSGRPGTVVLATRPNGRFAAKRGLQRIRRCFHGRHLR